MKRIRNRQLRTSRTLLAFTGLVLLGISALGLLLSRGAVDRYGSGLDSDTSVLNRIGARYLDSHQLPVQGIVVAVGVLLIAIGAGWLRQQIPPTRHKEDNHFDNPDKELAGTNIVAGGALAHALEMDLERSDAIKRARAEFRTDDNLLRLRLDIDDTASIDTIMDAVVMPAIERITSVAELGTTPKLQIDLRPLSVTTQRVH